MTQSDTNGNHKLDKLAGGHHHKARARAEAEAFEESLLAKLADPVEQHLARVAATMYFSVRLYHWRRMSRARRRDKETQEAVAAGNALERLLERLRFLPPSANTPTSQSSANVSHDIKPPRQIYCECVSGQPACRQCKERAARRAAERLKP
jgi:hypothetical protein